MFMDQRISHLLRLNWPINGHNIGAGLFTGFIQKRTDGKYDTGFKK